MLNLVKRAEVIRKIRDFFDSRGFLEVVTPLLSQDIIVDRYLEPFFVETTQGRMFLQTSPEFALKRLLVAGAEAIYQIGPVFRQGDRGPLHNPEFTMLEWYRTGDDYQSGMQLLGKLAASILNSETVEYRTLRSLFFEHVGLNPHKDPVSSFRQWTTQAKLVVPESFGTDEENRDDWVDFIFSETIQPKLGKNRPVVVYDYLGTQSQLAQTAYLADEEITISQRFELFVNGLELANGYHELLDAEILATRFKENNILREKDGKPKLPEKNRLLEAMRYGLPACSGTALGVDRLVMVAIGAETIDEVISFSFERA